MMFKKATAAGLSLLASSSAAAPVASDGRMPFDARPESYKHYWQYRGSDCFPGIELGNCSDTHPPPYSIQECKATCLATPNCGGFNLPNGHLKKLGCMEEMEHSERFEHLDLYILNEYPADRNYWWRVRNFDCNPGVELGDCGVHRANCKEACLADPHCAGFNQPNGHLKAMDCIQDVVDAGNWTHPQDLYLMFNEPEQRQSGIPVVRGLGRSESSSLQCSSASSAAPAPLG
jgi:hypothetical protein